MASHAARGQVTVAATPQACFDALTDYERLADWQGALKRVEVIERDVDGAVVEYVLDAKVREVAYRLRLDYEAPHRLVSRYVSGDFRDLSAQWRFTERDGATEVVLELEVDVGWFLPGPVRAIVREVVLGRALGDLKKHFEPVRR